MGEDFIISPRDRVYRLYPQDLDNRSTPSRLRMKRKFVDEISELRAISGHVLGAAGVQIPKNNLDNLHSSIKKMEHWKLWIPKFYWVPFCLGGLLSRAMGFLRGTLALVVILVKGHAFPTIVNVLPVGCDPLALVDKFTPVEDNIGLLETTFDEDTVLMFVFLEDVTALDSYVVPTSSSSTTTTDTTSDETGTKSRRTVTLTAEDMQKKKNDKKERQQQTRSKAEEQALKALMEIDGVGWVWSYMENDEEDHALVADEVTPTQFALMANTSAKSKVFDNSLCSKYCKKNNDSLNSKITDLTDKLFDANNLIYHYKLALAQVESRLVEYKEREVKYYETIKTLEFHNESHNKCIEILKKKLETLKEEKEGVDGKLAGYSAVPPPPAQLYLYPKKDLSWTGLPECADDTVTDYSRPLPTVEMRSLHRALWVPTVNRNFSPVNRKFSPGRRNFPTANRKFPTAIRKFPTGSTKCSTADVGMKGKAATYPTSLIMSHLIEDMCPLVKEDARLLAKELSNQRLGHLNFKTMNKLVRRNLVRGLPTKCFENDHTCTACLKGKQHKASCTKDASSQEVKKNVSSLRYISLPNWAHDAPLEFSSSKPQDHYSTEDPEGSGNPNPTASTSNPPADQIETLTTLVDCPKGVRPIGIKWVLKNKKDERGIVIRNKARLVAQGHTQEEGIDYDEVFAHVARIEAISLFLAYASFICFIDSESPVKVYKVEKAMYGLHQAPRAWYGTLSKYLLKNGFQRGTIDQTLFIRREFEALMHEKFQMSAMGELNFFLGLQVLQKEDGIFLSQDKYAGDILKKFGYS
nr:hypothetical protein [Tanacetum cinerariifolium]